MLYDNTKKRNREITLHIEKACLPYRMQFTRLGCYTGNCLIGLFRFSPSIHTQPLQSQFDAILDQGLRLMVCLCVSVLPVLFPDSKLWK